MNERIEKLRTASLEAVPMVSDERAMLVTEYWSTPEAAGLSPAMRRARVFRHILMHKHVHIGAGELIVGERGPAPKATPTYPEICCHTVKDLDILDSREKVWFRVAEPVKQHYTDTFIPFWRGRSLRDRIFNALDNDWKDAYEAGVFTEFQEQRAPGHTVNGDLIYRCGMGNLKTRILERIDRLDFVHDPDALSKREQLKAMWASADAIIGYAHRHADQLDILAAAEIDPDRKQELLEMATICRRVPEQAPETFWEALQAYWFVHVGVITEYNTWDSFNPGRLDQHLYPYYVAELEAGTLTPKRAKELLMAFWIKFNNQPAPPKVGVTAQESNTYTDFALINLGGVKADGSNAVNDLTYLILDVIEEMRILQPSSMVQVSKKNPDRFLKRALQIIRTGFGQPSIFNTDAIVQELVRQGKSLEDARCGGASGCVESGAFGKEAYMLTGYFNLPKILELTLHRGKDPRTGKQLGPDTGDPAGFDTMDHLLAAFRTQVNHFAEIKIRGNNIIERFYAMDMPAPFLSLLIDDCIENATDYHAGGARYNTSYIQGVGVGTLTDSLSAINTHVFETGAVTMYDLIQALDADFVSQDDLRQLLKEETPRYGNDDDRADRFTRAIFEIFYDAVNGKPNTRGGHHRINLLPTTVHVYFGTVTGALPEGRKAGEPLSEGISPVQGTDRNGPTAVINSAAKIDHLRTGGTLLNQKFTPDLLKDETELTKLLHLVRTYFRMDGHHIQFNVVDVDTLRDAQAHPEKYRDLIVRVAGYSDYFVDLGKPLQEEIMNRTEHMGF